MNKEKELLYKGPFFTTIFIIYILALLKFVVIKDGILSGHPEGWRYLFDMDSFIFRLKHSVQLHPFQDTLNIINSTTEYGIWHTLKNLLGNIIIFIPMGFFVCYFSRKTKSSLHVWAITVAASISIEASQLIFAMGITSIDDVILNSFGGWIGFLVFRFYISQKESTTDKDY